MRPLEGKKILITRDVHQASVFKSKLNDLGADVVCIATIKITAPPDWQIFDKAAQAVHDYDWLLFSSTNAVHQTINRLSILDQSLVHRPKLKIAAVGNQTASVAESYIGAIELIPDQFQAEGLVKALLEIGIDGKKILIPRALEGRDFLGPELEKGGAEVNIAPVYQNVVPIENIPLLENLIAAREVDWITFTSSSTVINFVQMLGDSTRQMAMPNIASIGSLTSETLAKYGLKAHITADPQNVDGIISGIIKWETDRQANTSYDC